MYVFVHQSFSLYVFFYLSMDIYWSISLMFVCLYAVYLYVWYSCVLLPDESVAHNSYFLQGKVPPDWTFWTWNDYLRDCRAFGKTLVHLDVNPFHIVNILGFNSVSPHPLCCDLLIMTF